LQSLSHRGRGRQGAVAGASRPSAALSRATLTPPAGPFLEAVS
jgi:hypothetical protein